jgi:hypothetical protein
MMYEQKALSIQQRIQSNNGVALRRCLAWPRARQHKKPPHNVHDVHPTFFSMA